MIGSSPAAMMLLSRTHESCVESLAVGDVNRLEVALDANAARQPPVRICPPAIRIHFS
jgi:hypothetical protein